MFGLVKKAAASAARPTNAMQTRLMSGGHGHGGPPPTGLEAKVRAYLPKDYQVRSRRERLASCVYSGCWSGGLED